MASNNNIDQNPSPTSNVGGDLENHCDSSDSNNGTQQHSGHHHTNQHQHQHQAGANGQQQAMVRQFACHAKSMSAGVVVSVPGISNNLATATGMNQNNVINNHIQQHQHQHHNHKQHPQPPPHQQQVGHPLQLTNGNGTGGAPFIHQRSGGGNQPPPVLSRTGHRERNHHRQHQQQLHQQSYHHNNQQHQMGSSTLMHPSSHHSSQNGGSSSNFLNSIVHQESQHPHVPHHPQTSRRTSIMAAHHGSSLIHPVATHHNRSSSAQLSGVPLIGGHNHNHTQSNHHMNSTSTTAVASVRGHGTINHPTSTNYTNSIWSIDEHMSKSQSKLASSTYLAQHPYLFNPSITDMSCDNISQGSRLPDGAPAPGYYSHHNHHHHHHNHHNHHNHHHNNNNHHHHGPAVSAAAAAASGAAGGQVASGGAGNAAATVPNSNGLSVSGNHLKGSEFLPICDLMFNLISMIVYFCENTFGIIALIALYYHSGNQYWALIGALFVVASNAVSQYLSFKWLFKAKLDDCKRKREAQEELETEGDCERRYFNRMATNMSDYPCGSCAWLPDSATEVQLKFLISITIDAILHLFCLGFLVRYIKLVIPVKDTARVRKEARDLCMLRMVHGFIQSAPLLLLQAYMICLPNSNNNPGLIGAPSSSGGTPETTPAAIFSLSVTSATLSLINVCWALASFTKYARKKYLQRFILTWLGILSQLLWRLGTVSSRIVALTIYGIYYNYWMLVVLALHWLTMFLWLMKPGNLLRDELTMGRPKKITFAAAIAWIYCFCYLNFEEHNSKLKMTSYYLIMFLENNLLLTVCLIFSSQVTWIKNLSILVVYLGFVFGMLFMFLYYKYFHVNVLNNGLSCSHDSIDSIADQLSPAGKKIAGFEPGTIRLKSEEHLSAASNHKQQYSDAHNMNTGCRR